MQADASGTSELIYSLNDRPQPLAALLAALGHWRRDDQPARHQLRLPGHGVVGGIAGQATRRQPEDILATWFSGKLVPQPLPDMPLIRLPLPFTYSFNFDWSAFAPVALIYLISPLETVGGLTALLMCLLPPESKGAVNDAHSVQEHDTLKAH